MSEVFVVPHDIAQQPVGELLLSGAVGGDNVRSEVLICDASCHTPIITELQECQVGFVKVHPDTI